MKYKKVVFGDYFANNQHRKHENKHKCAQK